LSIHYFDEDGNIRGMSIAKRDFSHLKNFPGTNGNSFDVVLRIADVTESLPGPVFALLLLVPAVLIGLIHRSWWAAAGLWLFSVCDWALLAALPRFGRSFGPAKPPTVLLAVLRPIPALLPLPLAAAAEALGTLLVIYGFWIEPLRLGITYQQLRSPKLAAGRPLRVLHLGDLHAEIKLTAREQHLRELLRSLSPDLILFSGDFINLSYLDDPRAREVARAVLAELKAPLGVFAVSGSPAVDLPELVPQVLAGLDHIRWLRDEFVTVTHEGRSIDIVGLTCTHKPFIDGPRLCEILKAAHPNQSASLRPFTILLYHTPDLAPEAAEAGVDLQLSGHTHGGQVRLPIYGALYAGSLYGKSFEAGRLQQDGLTLYITRGIGMEGKGAPRVRFLAPPEVILWDLYGVDSITH
jgi:predicted MPP superfamily phosphohydrolase